MTTLKIYLTPRASKNKIKGWRGEELCVSITSPPVDGKANDELIKFLSKKFGVPKSAISIVKGETSRHKTLRIESDITINNINDRDNKI